MKTTDIKVGIATSEDLASILDLSSTEYSAPYNTEAYWRWRYLNNPVAEVKVYVARNDAGQVVAMQPVSAYPMRVKGDIQRAHLLTGAITHRDYRRQGLFRRLVQQIIADLHRSGDLFIYTFPNELSVQGFRRFDGWEQREVLTLYVRFVASRGWLPTRSQIEQVLPTASLMPTRCGDLNIQEMNSFDGETTTLMDSAFVDPCAYILRSRAYLKWRYFSNPAARYAVYQAARAGELVGYLVSKTTWLYGLRSGLIIDLVAVNQEIARALVARAVLAAQRAGVQVMAYLIGRFNPYRKAFLYEKFLPVPPRVLPKRFYLYTFATTDAVRTLPWYVTWSDIDVV
jgi:GNAT superfamily N-acetyltransferase